MSARKRIAIVGVGESELGEVPGKNFLQLHAEAAKAALDDAGLEKNDIDGLFSAGVHMMHPLVVSEYLGLRPRYTDSTMTGGGVWEYFVEHAAGAIEAGLCETALLVYGATERSDVKKRLRTGDLPPLPRGPSQFEAPYGLTLIGKYAMAARRHMHQYGTTSRELDEGPHLVTNIVGCEPTDVRVGLRVEVVFEKIDDAVTLPKFRLVTS